MNTTDPGAGSGPTAGAATEQEPAPASGPDAATQTGPRVPRPELNDLSRLRRARQGRTLAGVAEGIGRQFDIDPTVVKVLFVVGAFFGGAGILLYAALWLFVPNEGSDNAIIGSGDQTRRVLILIGAAVAGIALVSSGWQGPDLWWGPVGPLVVVVLLAVAWLVLRDRDRNPAGRGDQNQNRSPWPAYTPPAPPAPPVTAAVTTAQPDQQQYVAPPRSGYRPPKRLRRTGLVLFWPVLALIAVALGGLGLWDTANAVEPSAYPALALAIAGAGLVLGAFWGRAGGIAFLGVVAAIALAVTSVFSSFGDIGHARRVNLQPLVSSEVPASYDLGTGDLVLDLSGVRDPEALAGREIDLSGEAGHIEVVVPSGVDVDVDADIGVAGGIDVGGDQTGGLGAESERRLSATTGSTAGSEPLELNIDLRVGEIDVRQSR